MRRAPDRPLTGFLPAAGGVLPGRVIPVPSEISAGCGLAWSVPVEQRETLEQTLKRRGLAFDAITEVDLY